MNNVSLIVRDKKKPKLPIKKVFPAFKVIYEMVIYTKQTFDQAILSNTMCLIRYSL